MEDRKELNKNLLRAVKFSNESEVKKYLFLGANVNWIDVYTGDTALHIACSNGFSYTIVQILLDRGCNPKIQNEKGDTVLHIACSRLYNVEIVQILLERGCNPNIRNKKGRTALHAAVSQIFVNVDVIRLLLDGGCNLNKKDTEGRTALHAAFSQSYVHADVIRLLLDVGCNPHEKDKKGRTALHATVSHIYVNVDVIRLLIDVGCNPNEKDTEGRTALNLASSEEIVNPYVIQLLLDSGCSPNEKDKKGRNPLFLIEKTKHYAYEEETRRARNIMREYAEHWKTGLPVEVKDLDKQSAKVFASLLEEEGYDHYEARVMLAGEQGTGKTTIARHLVGQGPTKIRKSTDGIGLYNGLSFIDRETEEWMHGKQGFTLSELAISRSLRRSNDTSSNTNAKGDLTDRQKKKSNRPIHKEIIQEHNKLVTPVSACSDLIPNESNENAISSHELSVSAKEIQELQKLGEVITGYSPQIEDTSASFEFDGRLRDRSERSSDRLALQDFLSDNRLSPATDLAYGEPHISLTEITTTNDSDDFNRNEIMNDELHFHGEITKEDVFYIRSEKDPSLVQDKCLDTKDSISLPEIYKTAVFEERKNKTQATKQTYHVKAKESPEEILPKLKKVVIPQIVRREKVSSSSDDFEAYLNEKSSFLKEYKELARPDSLSKPHIKSQEIMPTTEVVKDIGIITKLKTLFGVQKDVTEIKVSMTKDRFLKESKKAGKKKLHQKKIAPVIIWDFGGQDVFYSTHQTFLTYRAIYLLVVDGSRALDDPCPFDQYLPGKSGGKTARDYLKFWINTIVTYCKGSGPGFPKIMIVLTHKDKLKAVEVEPRRLQLFHDIENMFSGSPLLSHLVIEDHLFVNARNKRDPEMAKIKKVITEQAIKQPTWGQNLPKCFIPLEWEFDSLLSRNIPLITMEQMRKINSLQPVRPLTEEELKVFLKFQHSVGRILYFDEENLDQHIILSPTHLIDAFKSIVTDRRFCEGDTKRLESWNLMNKKGIIEKNSIDKIWKKKRYNKFKDHREYLLGVMTHLDILVEPKRYDKSQTRIPAEFYYVASMVRTNDTTGYLMSPTFTKRNIAIAFSHSSSMIPPALSFRFISYCLSIFAVKKTGQNDEDMLFHRSAIFNIDQSLDMCVNCDDEVIVVRLVHLRNRTLIMRDLATSIRECLAVALEKISQLYVKTSSTDVIASKSSFNLSLCCSSFDDPCFLPMSTIEDQDDSWICPKHGIEHTKDLMSSWDIQKDDDIQCGKSCPVTDTEFLKQIPLDIHFRRLSMQYSINEIKELGMHLGMDYQTWDDLYVTFGEEPERLKFEALRRPFDGSHLSFNDIRKAVEFGKIRTIHCLCKVVRGNLLDLYQEPEKWDLVPTEEHLDRVAPLVGNNSLAFLVELGLEFRTWEEIKYKQIERDLVKLNRQILQEWKSNICSLHNIRPSLRDIGKAFNNIGKNIRILENVLADLL